MRMRNIQILVNMIINIFEKNTGSVHELWERSLRNILRLASSDINLEIRLAPEEFQSAINQWENSGEIFAISGPEFFNKEQRLFIPGASEFYKQHCLNEAPHALYGCCLWGKYIAVEYAPDEHKLSTQLHESLHLFGVDECYDPHTLKPVDECVSGKCVMRYGVSSTEVCSHVLSQLVRSLTKSSN
jgi:hypothetical protein